MTQQMPQGPVPLWEVYDIEDAFGPASLGGSNRIKRVYFHVAGMRDDYVELSLSDFQTPGKVAAAIEAHVASLIDARTLKSVETL